MPLGERLTTILQARSNGAAALRSQRSDREQLVNTPQWQALQARPAWAGPAAPRPRQRQHAAAGRGMLRCRTPSCTTYHPNGPGCRPRASEVAVGQVGPALLWRMVQGGLSSAGSTVRTAVGISSRSPCRDGCNGPVGMMVVLPAAAQEAWAAACCGVHDVKLLPTCRAGPSHSASLCYLVMQLVCQLPRHPNR